MLGGAWRAIDRQTALTVAVGLLHRDLAYDYPIIPEEEARQLAGGFFELVGDAHAYFTNGTWAEPPVTLPNGVVRGASWDPISQATFDAGIICVGANETALLWVEDED